MPCLTCGVPNGGAGYCEAHQPTTRWHRTTPRGTSTQRGYGADWQRLRKQILEADSQCHYCGKHATTVDHIVPISVDPSLRLERTNLVPACLACNTARSNVTQRDNYDA